MTENRSNPSRRETLGSESWPRFLDAAIIIVLAAVFLFSAVDKLYHYEGFLKALRNYVIVPAGTAEYLAPMVIGLEVLLGFGLALRRFRKQAAVSSAATLCLFTLALALNHRYGGNGICGCWFTLTLASGTADHIMQNLALMGCSLFIWWEAARDRHRLRAVT